MAFEYHSCGVLVFSTANYDAMKKFLADFGFDVTESRDQLLPLFGVQRGARVCRGDLRFQLEESDDPTHRAIFSMMVTDFSDSELERVKALGYKFEHEQGLSGGSHTFRSPDGGVFVV